MVPSCSDMDAWSEEEVLESSLCIGAGVGHKSREELDSLFKGEHKRSLSQKLCLLDDTGCSNTDSALFLSNYKS